VADKKQKRPPESVNGQYGAIPTALLDSKAFMGASYPAKALLFELIRQHNGKNNGRFQLAFSWLAKRGWKSRDVIQRAKAELIESGLLIQTKQGGLNVGATWYAVTWLPISNFVGLDIQSKDYRPGAWAFMDKLPVTIKRKGYEVQWDGINPMVEKNANAVPLDGKGNTAKRYSTVPSEGTANALTVPGAGT
jgi:hypothetical protein